MLLMLSYVHIIVSHNDFSYCVLLPLILLIMAGFFGFFFPNKIRPQKMFNDCLFFKEKTPQLFIFAVVYIYKKCVLIE